MSEKPPPPVPLPPIRVEGSTAVSRVEGAFCPHLRRIVDDRAIVRTEVGGLVFTNHFATWREASDFARETADAWRRFREANRG